MRAQVRRHTIAPPETTPTFYSPARRSGGPKRQPAAQCARCSAWLSTYRKPRETLCLPCQKSAAA